MHGARYQTHFQVPRSKGVEKQGRGEARAKGERNISRSENTANEESRLTASTVFSDKVHIQHSRIRFRSNPVSTNDENNPSRSIHEGLHLAIAAPRSSFLLHHRTTRTRLHGFYVLDFGVIQGGKGLLRSVPRPGAAAGAPRSANKRSARHIPSRLSESCQRTRSTQQGSSLQQIYCYQAAGQRGKINKDVVSELGSLSYRSRSTDCKTRKS